MSNSRRQNPEDTRTVLSEGQEMRLRIAARYLEEFGQRDLGTAPPAVAIQTAQRLAATVGDLLSMVQDLASRLSEAESGAAGTPGGRHRMQDPL
ncbi:hypothetical protein [Streptacidiphilus sp. PAMC 29251]